VPDDDPHVHEERQHLAHQWRVEGRREGLRLRAHSARARTVPRALETQRLLLEVLDFVLDAFDVDNDMREARELTVESSVWLVDSATGQ